MRDGRADAHDRQNGPFLGVLNGFVGFFDAALEGGLDLAGVRFLQAFEPAGNAPEEQRQDDAGIAPRGAEELRRDLCRNGFYGKIRIGQGVDRRDGHAHVAAGIAVRDGIDVQMVDLVASALQSVRAG